MSTTLRPAPLELLSAHADLPGAALLLDPERLPELLGRDVVPFRTRIKPGSGVMVAHRAAEGPTPGAPAVSEIGWTQLVASADKREGILRRAARTGATVTEHPAPGPGVFLLSGGFESDPRLGPHTARVLRKRGRARTARVLSVNPSRHLVLELPAAAQVLRIAHRPLDRLLRTGAVWRERGLPTAELRSWGRNRHVVIGDRWGYGDLAALARTSGAVPAAEALGGIIAQLHTSDPGHLPPARIGEPVPAVVDAVRDLLPHRSEQVRRLVRILQQRLPAADGASLIHGDLTPDQVLVDRPRAGLDGMASPGAPDLRVIDLDRSGRGPREADLGSWLAWCLVEGAEHLATAFLTGYANGAPVPTAADRSTWTARALLAGALDPMRRFADDWLGRVEQRLDLAETVLRDARPPLRTGPVDIPRRVCLDERSWTVHRAWPDDGRGLPLELGDGGELRGARLDARSGAVTVLDAGSDPRLPALSRVLADHPGSTVVSHRPGKRAVVRTGETFIKVVRAGRTDRIRRAVERATAFDGPFRTPRILASDEETVTFSALAGAPLHEPLPLGDGTWRRAWRTTLAAWTEVLAGTAVGAPETHGPRQEEEVLRSWHERAEQADADGARRRDRSVDAGRSALRELPEPSRPVLIHRDLHDQQLLWHERLGPGLLDVDTAAFGDAALDLGNLRAHARWRELQGIWTPEHTRIVCEEVDRAAWCAGVPPTRLDAYEIGTMARLTCVYAFRPRWREAVRALSDLILPGSGSTGAHPGGGIPTPNERKETR